MEISTVLQNAHTQEDAARIITNGTSAYSSEELAAQYAWQAAKEQGYEADADCIEAHLDIIKDAGAVFDYQPALKIATAE